LKLNASLAASGCRDSGISAQLATRESSQTQQPVTAAAAAAAGLPGHWLVHLPRRLTAMLVRLMSIVDDAETVKLCPLQHFIIS